MAIEILTNLLWLIKQDDDEIDWYLTNVNNQEFKADVKELMKNIDDKEPIKEAIKRLSELL